MDGGKAAPKPAHPRATTNFLSALTYAWMIPIFYRGVKTEMGTKDLFEPLTDHKSKLLGDRFEKEWEQEKKIAKDRNGSPKLMNVIRRIFFFENMFYGFMVFVLEIPIRSVQPFFIALLIRYFQSGDLPEPGENDPTFIYRLPEIFEPPRTKMSFDEAIFFCSAIVGYAVMGIFINHPYFMGVMHQGMRCRVGACSLIYRKALKLNSSALHETTAGQMVNLLSNDVNRFDIAVILMHYLWVAPLEALLATYFMYRIVGWPTLLGLLFMISQIPLQVLMGKKTSEYRLRTAMCTDERVRLTNEVVSGIQVIKMYAWEKPFADLVANARKRELNEIRGSSNVRAFITSFYVFPSRFAIFLTVIGFALGGNLVTADAIFIITSFYNNLKIAVALYFPMANSQVAEALISVGRLQKFLLNDEIVTKPSPIPDLLERGANGLNKKNPKIEVKFENASFKWLADNAEPNLRGLTLDVRPGKFVAIIGPVGSGKSTLLQAILREVSITSGFMSVQGEISYAAQEPWLFAGTIRQNILFGLPYEQKRYRQVIIACALKRDLELLPNGDKTQVGDRGSALSGGQRARINLARAAYKDSDIYLLDDPLSAVDAHVGKQLFENCIDGFLKGKTVILVTHQLQHLNNCDHIVILNNGVKEAEGSAKAIQSSAMKFAQLLQQRPESASEKEAPSSAPPSRKGSISSIQSQKSVEEVVQPVKVEVSQGKSSSGVYTAFFKAANSWFLTGSFFILLVGTQVVASVNDLWASRWAAEDAKYINLTSNVPIAHRSATMMNVYIFTALNIGTVVISLLRSWLFFYMCRVISQNLHDSMFGKVTRAPMKFFHDNSAGSILNRFSKDMGSIDEVLPTTMVDCFQIFLYLFAIVILCALTQPILLVPTVFTFIVFGLLRIVFVKTSRNIKRLEGATRSPVFSHLNTSLQGLMTIRAFGAQGALQNEFDHHQDLHNSAWYIFIASSRAFGLWLDGLCVVYIAVVCFATLYLGKSGADAGLAITQSIGLLGMFQWGMRQSAEMENQMTSVERVLEYADVEQEPPLESTPENKPPPSWPSEGAIEFEDVVLRYDPEADPVLTGVNLNINPREKIGIVGRTGAGKSTLTAAMFRLAYTKGKIKVDSVDTTAIGLHDLRRQIAIIPQEPVIFSGTLRRNLDPFDEYPDWCLWNALEEVELKAVVDEQAEGLHSRMSEGGSNFSVGQRQLICLARAIVRNNRILIMDEATANVDPQTDKLIQRTIRRKFGDCTVLTIAHRLNTVIDSDRILVMDAGQKAEMDHPHILLKNAESHFSALVDKTGKSTAQKLRRVAKKNYKLKEKKEEAMRMLKSAQEDADLDQESGSSRSTTPNLSD